MNVRVVATGTVLVIGAAVAAGLYFLTDRTRPAQAPDPAGIFRTLRTTAFAPPDVPPGFRFRDVGSTLAPSEADRRGLWLVYATFDGPADRTRIAFQVFRSPNDASAFVTEHFGSTCEQDEVSWECVGRVGPVVVKGDVECSTERCIAAKTDALDLLVGAKEHLGRLGIS